MNKPCFSVSILWGRSLDARLDKILCFTKMFWYYGNYVFICSGEPCSPIVTSVSLGQNDYLTTNSIQIFIVLCLHTKQMANKVRRYCMTIALRLLYNLIYYKIPLNNFYLPPWLCFKNVLFYIHRQSMYIELRGIIEMGGIIWRINFLTK